MRSSWLRWPPNLKQLTSTVLQCHATDQISGHFKDRVFPTVHSPHLDLQPCPCTPDTLRSGLAGPYFRPVILQPLSGILLVETLANMSVI